MVIPWEVIRRDLMIFYYYKITNIENGSFYIGITENPANRKNQHFKQLRAGNHANYKIQNDYNIYGENAFQFEIIEELDTESKEEAYQHEYDLIQQLHATSSYNILEVGLLNPVYSEQVVAKLKETHQNKYDDVLQYSFDGKQFTLVKTHRGFRDASRDGQHDFRAIQNSSKTTQSHHGFYWVLAKEKEVWLSKFLKRHKCCVAKINENSGEIEDTALTIKEFAEKYNTTYDKIYHSLKRNDRCERKYKFIRITAEQFAEINNLSL